MNGARGPRTRLVGRIVYREYGRGCIMNSFFLIVDETPRTVLIKEVDSVRTIAENPLIVGCRGTEVPAPIDEMSLISYDPNALVRARKHEPAYPGDQIWFSYKDDAYFLWDGKPRIFDHMG